MQHSIEDSVSRPRVLQRLAALAALLAATFALTMAAAVWLQPEYVPPEPPTRQIGRMAELEGGRFLMGNDLSKAACERPAHPVHLSPLSMDVHEVTNGQFAEFVQATGYVTTAERRGWSLVLDPDLGTWQPVAGADWRHPGGPISTLQGRDALPVVHVSWHDAEAYAGWAGKALATEAQWEYAARAGLRDCDYPWGPEELIAGRYQANYRQEEYFAEGSPPDGFDGPAPVMSFRANRFGLYDMAGNVWEWCADRFAEDYYEVSPGADPRGPEQGHRRVLRGGSWATAGGERPGYRVWTRWCQPEDHASDQVGFRCVR